jgi:hypothetical protein
MIAWAERVQNSRIAARKNGGSGFVESEFGNEFFLGIEDADSAALVALRRARRVS